jgi:hypothetical protein
VDGGVLAGRFLERESFGFSGNGSGHGRDFGGRRFKVFYIGRLRKRSDV